MKSILITVLLSGLTTAANAKAILQGTVSFLNSGSRPASGVKISAFGANDFYTTDAGMFRLEFPDKKPGDKVKIIVGSNDKDGIALELVNDKVIAQMHLPSNPDDDIVEIIVCKLGQRNEAALRYNGLIVKNINENMEKRLRQIDEKLDAAKIDAETITTLQYEKEKLAAERDSALSKAEEQALFIASINLDKASQLVKEAMLKVDRLEDISGAIAILDNEMLLSAYDEAKSKIQKGKIQIDQVVNGFKLKIFLLGTTFQNEDINICCRELDKIYKEQNYVIDYPCFDWTILDKRKIELPFNNPSYIPTLYTQIGGRKSISIDAYEGQLVNISASGSMHVGAFVSSSGPDGLSTGIFGISLSAYKLVPKFNHGALMYRLPGDTEWRICGSRNKFVVPKNGKLEIIFEINDSLQGDNAGAFNVEITVK